MSVTLLDNPETVLAAFLFNETSFLAFFLGQLLVEHVQHSHRVDHLAWQDVATSEKKRPAPSQARISWHWQRVRKEKTVHADTLNELAMAMGIKLKCIIKYYIII